MSAASDDIRLKYAPLMKLLAEALEQNDEPGFYGTLDEMARLREGSVLHEIDEVTHGLEHALARFCAETRITDLAEKDVPDARARLEHVLKMTDEAAHHTMDLVETACAPAERISRQLAELTILWQGAHAAEVPAASQAAVSQALAAFWTPAHADAEQVRKNLQEVILAQGYQDLSGQIIRSVMTLIGELESALVALIHLARGSATDSPESAQSHIGDMTQGYGPVVPRVNDTNVVNGQDDIDALLSNLNI
ncbi:MAG: protein phosphatase CheZ [Gammaproteobacteria bacterium]|nr:protein phosphatase CheZ [Gammaproteobacteria bacterium]